jgi:hypothetical protein
LFVFTATLIFGYVVWPSQASGVASPNIVISQVYGGGGNGGAPYTNDFIELFNRGNAAVSLNGWSVQYASSTGTSWQKTDLSGTLAPGQYLLVQEASGGANGAALPAPDVTGTVSMAATAGKVVLTNTNTLITSGTACPSGATVVDVVGYGSAATCFEGAGPTPAPSATNAVVRGLNGCTETDNNAMDFAAIAPNPRNTASPAIICGAPTNPSGVGAANPNPVTAGNVVLLTVTVTPGTNPASTGVTVTANISAIGGAVSQPFYDNGTNGDVTPNDNLFSFQPLVEPTTAGLKNIPITIADAQARSSSTAINLAVQVPAPPGNVVISQVYGGGGNSGAPFTNDFIELFNRSGAPVNLAGWSVQYASSSSSSWQKTDLTGTLAPGQYLLIQEASGGANGAPLPTPDIVGTISMASTGGKVALVNNTTLLNMACPLGPNVIDFVGYGSGASCFEGSGSTPAPGATNAILRVGQGCGDTNNNALNFVTGAPSPRNNASPRGDCSGGAKFDPTGTSLKLTDPAVCTGTGNILVIEARFTNSGNRAQGNNPGSEFTAQLPANLVALPNTCTSTSGDCTVTSALQIDWNGPVAIGASITIRFNAQVTDNTAAGTQLCVNSSVSFDSDNDGINDATAQSLACVTLNCPAVGPGMVFPPASDLSDQKSGSVLVFPFYSSISLKPTRENARISITNTEPTRRIAVHLFFIQEDAAAVADAFVCLTPNQTTSFLTSDFDPDISGYLVAIAVDDRTGCPINFNFLIGDEYVKLDSGFAANLAAESFAAIAGAPPACNENSVTAEVRFDGVSYNAAPRVLAADNILSAVDGNSTLLVIDRIGGNLATGVSTVGQLFGLLFDDMEHGYSFERSTTRRQFRIVLSNSDFPRTAPRLTTVIPAGRSGWMKFWRDEDGGMIGAAINFNPNTATSSAAFNQGRNLHKLTLTTGSSFIVPVFPPGC